MNCRNSSEPLGQRKRWWGKAAALAAIFALGLGANAQVATTYTFSQAAGTYTAISGGTLVASHTGFAAGINSMDDQVYNLASATIPFTFTYNGTGYTGLNINSNGYITFGATAPSSSSYTPISSTTAYAGAVAAFARDLQGGFAFNATRTSGSNTLTAVTATGPIQVGDFITGTGIPAGATITAIGVGTITMSANATTSGTNFTCQAGGASWSNIRYETVGSAPNRVFVIQYSGFKRFGTTNTTVQHMTLNFQIRLNETTNNIEIVYNDCSPGLTTFTTVNEVGLRGPNNTFATNVNNRRNQKNVNDDWVNSVIGTTNASGMLFNNVAPANVIANGLTYTWTAPSPCTGTPNAGAVTSPVAVCSGNTAVLTATGLTTGLGISYQWEESPDGSTGWASVVGGTGATTASYTTTAITATRYFRLVTTCSTGPDVNNTNVVTVNVNPGQFDEDFSSGTIVGNCWSQSGTGSAANLRYNAASGYGSGTGSIIWDFFSQNGLTLIYTSPVLSPIGSGVQVEFDVAGRQYSTDLPVDTIYLEASSNGGGSWSVIQMMTNEVGGLLNTTGAASNTELNTPLAGEWASLAYPVPAGTDRIRFRGISDFGNNVLIDNIALTAAPLCSSPTATPSAVVPNCTLSQFSFSVDLTGLGDATDVDIVANVNGGGDAVVHDNVSGLTTYAMGPYTMGDNVVVTVIHNGDGACNVGLGSFTYSAALCPTVVTCGSTLNDTYCYIDNEVNDWTYTASAAFPLQLVFNDGFIENCCDQLRIYDGVDNTGALLFDSFDAGFAGDDLTGVSALAASGSIYMEFEADGSVDCSNDGDTPWDFDLFCLACTAPDVAVNIVPNCPGGFDVDVVFTDFGDGSGATIAWSLNSVPQTPFAAVIGSNVLPGGPFASGADVDVTVAHESDTDCDVAYNNNTYACPPANDDCGGAIALTVNANFLCGVVTAGTTNAATASVQPDVDSGTPDDDVWYSFVATASTHRVSLLNVSGFADMGHSVYRALPVPCAAGGMTLINTSDPNESNPAGLTIGETYFVRVYAWGTGASNVTFNICIGTPPPPPANDLCAAAISVNCNTVTNSTTVNSTNTGAPATCSGLAINTAGGVWYSVAGFDGPMTVNLSGSSFDTKVAVFTGTCGSLVCVDSDDDDGDGTTSLLTWTGSSAQTYLIYVTGFQTQTGTITMALTCGSLSPTCTENGLNLEFQNAANANEVTWEILNENGGLIVLSGADPIPSNSIGTQSICLPDGCYRLRILDSGGDGMVGGTNWPIGGYTLRTQGTNLRLIDNQFNFDGVFNGSVSAIANGGTFCVPVGVDRPIFTSCDKLDWVDNKFIVASPNAAVTAQFGLTNNTSGYEFWFFDPNGSYSFRRFRNHATSDGTGTGATRACHFRINGWTNTVSTPHIPANVLMNVRIRARVAGAYEPFGPACLFKIDAARAACPLTKLQDNPADADFSCGLSKTFGGSNSASNKLVAAAPQFTPTVASTSVRYQFRFRIPGEYPAAGSCIVRPPQTSPTIYLNWTTGDKLKCNTQYQVDVRVSKDGGATWCVANADPTCAAPQSIVLWGKVCNVNIGASTFCPGPAQGGGNNFAAEGNNGEFTMYPNPNRGDQLFLSLAKVADGVQTVSVDLFDMTGKRAMARTIAVQDGFLNTALDLNGDLAGGVYLVNITAGDKTYTQRLVIQP